MWEPGRGRALRVLAVAGAVGVTAAVATCVVQHVKRARRRHCGKANVSVPSLADEIKEALVREAEELQRELPDEELQSEFAQAVAWVSSAGGGLSSSNKLQLYGCYKQVTTGDAPESRPWGMEAGMKWDAWNELRGLPRAEAMQGYVETLDSLAPTWQMEDPSAVPAAASAALVTGMGPCVSTMGRIGDPADDDIDETPVGQLCEMIANGDTEKACALLRRQPKLAFQMDKDGMVPLHWAADRGELGVAGVLIRMAGEQSTSEALAACLNAQDANGDTPLHYAVNTDNPELARLLVAAGADAGIKNEDGETPAKLAEGEESLSAVFGAA